MFVVAKVTPTAVKISCSPQGAEALAAALKGLGGTVTRSRTSAGLIRSVTHELFYLYTDQKVEP